MYRGVDEMRDLGDTVLALARLKTHGEASGVDLESPIAYVFEFEESLAGRCGPTSTSTRLSKP